MTGVTLLSVEVAPKLLELLHEAVPSTTIIGLLVNPANPNAETQSKYSQAAALQLGLQVQILNASTERDFDAAFATLKEVQAGALVISQDVLFNTKSAQLAAMTVLHEVPAISMLQEFATAGGLISYGASRSDSWRQAGVYAGRILKGEKPADLPVVQATKLELIVNLRTAKALGITFPLSLFGRANEVIE